MSELLLQQHILYLLDYSGGPAAPDEVIPTLEADIADAKANPSSNPQPGTTGYTPKQLASLEQQLAAAKSGKTPPPIPDLFRQLVEDYVALAHAEAKNHKATMTDVVKSSKNVMDLPKVLVGPPSTVMSMAVATKTIQKYITKYLGHG